MDSTQSFGYPYSGCGMQICSHPACWEATKRLNIELNIKQFYSPGKVKSVKPKPDIPRTAEEYFQDEFNFPSLSIHSLVEEIETEAQISLPCLKADTSHHSQLSFDSYLQYKVVPNTESNILTKLQLNSLAQDSGNGITPAPANTPMQTSSHKLVDSPLQLKKSMQFPSKSNNYSVNNIKLDFKHGERKKMYVWHNTQKKEMQSTNAAKRSKAEASNLVLPLDPLPEQPNETMWKNKRSKKSLKAIQFTNIQPPFDVARKSSTIPRKKSKKVSCVPSAEIPSEIEKLRLVPTDVLVRVVKLALQNKVLTSEQADLLMHQVTGKKFFHYNEENEEKKRKSSLCLTSQKKVHTPRSRSKISPSLSSSNPMVYKLDPVYSDRQKKVYKNHSSASISSRKVLEPIDMISPSKTKNSTPPLSPTPSSSQFRKHLPITIKSTVGCVIKTPDEDAVISLPKPFHYLKNPHEMSLHPLPSPPPPAPLTERDSSYNEILGGSTVIANPPSSRSMTSYERPVSALSKRESTFTNDFKAESSTKSTLWPQVDEVYYIGNEEHKTDMNDEIAPDNVKNKMEETKLPILEEGSSDTHTIESSPVPPPPSPVMAPLKLDEVLAINHVKEKQVEQDSVEIAINR